MNLKWQSLTLVVILLISVTVTQFGGAEAGSGENLEKNTDPQPNPKTKTSQKQANLLSFKQESVSSYGEMENVPTRKWNVLDPKVDAKAAIVHSLDSNTPFFYKNIHETHPLASLTKLITAVVVMEEAGLNKKIPITKETIETRGESGQLKSGEVYTSKNLLRIMLMVSSNDAAAAFEDYFGGKEKFVKIAEKKMKKIGMDSTTIHDGSGLSDSNEGTANDLLKLTKYILQNHPKIFQWTRNSSILAQPINGVKTKKIININPLVDESKFLGGKTGTSKAAGQNLVSLYKIKNRKAAIILLGSPDRDREARELINWTKKAYQF